MQKNNIKKTDSEVLSLKVELGTRISAVSDLVGGKKNLADLTGISESQLYRCINGSSSMTVERLVAIASASDVSIEWLATGVGSMKKTAHLESNEAMTEFALIPGYNVQISAGNGLESEQEQVTRKLAFRHKWLKFKGLKEKDLVLVFTKGDSMEPTISDNNTLMIDTSQQELQDGHIYVIRTNNHLVVKRIQNTLNGFILISDNKEYERVDITYDEAEDLQVIGRVVWIGKDV
jgi:phage repressor protein C with HTH and peptisase S24 domain